MAAELPAASLRLAEQVPGIADKIRFFPDGTKTAQDAAEAIGCEVSAIVKSLVFVVETDASSEPVVALVPGDLMLDTDKLAAVADALRARRASLDEVRGATGYAAGGAPPFGHGRRLFRVRRQMKDAQKSYCVMLARQPSANLRFSLQP